MHKTVHRRAVRLIAAATAALLTVGAFTACSSGGDSPSDSHKYTQADIDKALKKESTLTVWAWTGYVADGAKAFQEKYPNVKVKVVNPAAGGGQYTKLTNALKAGKGAPDVMQLNYFTIPQYVLTKGLANLADFGFDKYKNDYTPSAWNQIAIDGGVYGLPQNAGPVVMYYNKAVFDKYGLAVPKTWDEYVDVAKKLHQANPKAYIANDAGDNEIAMSYIWQAGGRPFKVDGNNVTINLQDKGTKKWANSWNRLLENGLLSNIPSWSDEWYKGLGDGTLATLVSGGWMPQTFMGGNIDAAKGDWRVAPVPTYDGGAPTSSEVGGGSLSVTSQSKNQLVAAAFVEFMNHSKTGTELMVKAGDYPAVKSILNSDEFLDQAPEYFGGQQINKELVAAGKSVSPGWQYLPFQLYAASVFADTVGKSYTNHTDLNAGLKAWQDALTTYGKQQGYKITN